MNFDCMLLHHFNFNPPLAFSRQNWMVVFDDKKHWIELLENLDPARAHLWQLNFLSVFQILMNFWMMYSLFLVKFTDYFYFKLTIHITSSQFSNWSHWVINRILMNSRNPHWLANLCIKSSTDTKVLFHLVFTPSVDWP